MALSDIKIKQLKAKDKPYKVFDGRGLYIYVVPNGSKYWRVKYSIDKKENIYTIGEFPEISLHDARVKLHEIKSLLRQGINPQQEKRFMIL